MSQESALDFSRLYCQIHPYQLITNYCNDEKCLVGLCATCVCTHTQMHGQIGTLPHYQNIRDTFSSLHNEVRNQVNLVQEDKCRLGSIRQSIEVNKISIRKTIKQIRDNTISKIKDEFEELQKKIMADIIAEQKKQGYHSNTRFETLFKNLSKQVENLLTYIDGLNSPNFIEWTRKLKKESLHETILTREKIERELMDNATYTACLKWNQNFFTEIESAMKKLFTLQFVIPHPGNKVSFISSPLTQFSPPVLKNQSPLSRSNSQTKHSYNFARPNSITKISKLGQSTSYGTCVNDGERLSTPLQKKGLLKKGSLNASDTVHSEFTNTKDNLMTQSSFVARSPAEMTKKSIAFNKFSPKQSLETEKLQSLIEEQRKSRFEDSPKDFAMDSGEKPVNSIDSRIRINQHR